MRVFLWAVIKVFRLPYEYILENQFLLPSSE